MAFGDLELTDQYGDMLEAWLATQTDGAIMIRCSNSDGFLATPQHARYLIDWLELWLERQAAPSDKE